jgi:NADH dehydrogenase
MILVTGGTGFIGRSVVRRLHEARRPFRLLLRPARRSPHLPPGLDVPVSLASLADRRGVRAALVGIESVVHLAGGERSGRREDLILADIEGTRALAETAAEAGVLRLLYVSHLGADRHSAYPVLRAKAMAEEALRDSPVPCTILRSGIVFGPGDRFTTALAGAMAAAPGFFPVPSPGAGRLQPLWVEDLSACLIWALDDDDLRGQTFEVGGPEYLTYVEILRLILETAGMRRALVSFRPPYMRGLFWVLERILPEPPLNRFWLDYLASDRTADLSTLPRVFGLQPVRMQGHLAYLQARNWAREFYARQVHARRTRR